MFPNADRVVMETDLPGAPGGVCRMWAEEQNIQSLERTDILRGRYLHYARVNNITLPEIRKDRFLFFAGMDSPGGTIITAQDRSVQVWVEHWLINYC